MSLKDSLDTAMYRIGLSPKPDATDPAADEYVDDGYRYDTQQTAPAKREGATPGVFTTRPVADYRPTIVRVAPTEYGHADQVGEPFRDGDIVVFSLADMSRDDRRRMIDFTAGLVYAADGSMKKIDRRTFAVIPNGVTVTMADLTKAAHYGNDR